jgi:peptide/nickel transport system substrate-binding protein
MKTKESLFSVLIIGIVVFLMATSSWGAGPVRGGEFKASMDLEPVSGDPLFGNGTYSDRHFFNLFYENLIRLTGEGEFIPLLAEGWDFAPDNKSITFKLRKGVIFHDGTPFNAEVAKWNLDRARDPKLNAPHSKDLIAINSVDILDDDTIRVNMEKPSASVMAMLAFEGGSMISPTAYKNMGRDFARNPVGTGPYKFVKWIGSDRVMGERFDGYWQNGLDGNKLPYMDKVTVRFIANTTVKLMEIKAGNIYLADNIQVKDFKSVETDPKLKLVDRPHGIHQFMCFNVTKPPFDNKDLRLAVCYGINREAIMKVITRGYGTVTPTIVQPNEFIYTQDLPTHTYDPAKSKEHLKKSGFTGQVVVSVIQRDPDTQIAQLIQAQLKEVGIDMKIEVLERKAWVAKVITKDRKFHAGTLRTMSPAPDPDFNFAKYFGRNASLNWDGLSNEVLFEVVEKGAQVLDREKRKVYYKKAQEVLLSEGFYAFLFTRPVKDVALSKVHNVRRDLNGSWRLGEVWMDK